jgi:hypothetical protein
MRARRIGIAAAFLGLLLAATLGIRPGTASDAPKRVSLPLVGQSNRATPDTAPPTGNNRNKRTPTPTATSTLTATPTATPTAAPTQPPPPTPGGNPHSSITRYDGPQTCVACHPTEANDALHSEHMQWQGKWNEVNTYCTAPRPADWACRTCHASTGHINNLTVNDVDCLVCHSDTYQRSLGPMNVPITVTDWQGTARNFKAPQKDASGEYTMVPRFDLMPPGTTMVQLAQNVQKPTRATCLKCHAKAGGSDGAKRGDISSADTNPSLTSDVHMSPQGANMLCQTCHVPTDHKIPGRGIDLQVSEGGAGPTCAGNCHSSKPHDSAELDKHTDRVACQTCHIPTFAKDVPTEMSRDWTQPVWSAAGLNGQGAWLGTEVHASNVKPQYTFWNGQSYVYNLPDPISANPDGSYTMAKALGSINAAGSKLYPIKVHTSVQPRHNATGAIVQYDVLWNFLTGKYQEAAANGVNFMGLTGPSSFVTTRVEQLITHGVTTKQNAVQCSACHQTRTQVNLPALGYTLKGSQAQVCTQCHEQKSNPGFNDVHNKHVTDKGYDCSWCHTFSRPERNLRLPR